MSEPIAQQIAEVDWGQAWLAPLRELGSQWAEQLAGGSPIHTVLNKPSNHLQHVTRQFVPQSALPAEKAYEQFIYDTGSVPTRSNLHDFFNALIWQHYPLAKRQLNKLQAQALEEQGVGPVRGPLRDACTLFDENGAVLQAPDVLWQALLARDWQALFVTHRALWDQASLIVFGHATLEQLVRPRKGITVHVLARPCPLGLVHTPTGAVAHESIAKIDQWLSTSLQLDFMRTKPFTPLPLLGIPGWCAENAELSFYDDLAVFRPRRVVAQA